MVNVLVTVNSVMGAKIVRMGLTKIPCGALSQVSLTHDVIMMSLVLMTLLLYMCAAVSVSGNLVFYTTNMKCDVMMM